MAEPEKLVIMVTHGPEDPELAAIPFAMAGAAVASDVDVVMGFQGDAVELVTKGGADTVQVDEFAPLGELLDTIKEMGAQLLVCSPSVKNRHLDEEDLVEGVEVVAAGRFVAEITSATNTLVY